MKTISVVDTTICSYNLGNEIIMDAVNSILYRLFPETFLFRLPSEEKFSRKALRYMRDSDYVFFGGTNSFSSHLLRYKQHGFRMRDLVYFRDLTSLGMGWWQYQARPDPYSAFFWRTLLSRQTLHSVRDSYTKEKLKSIGISNVVNTSCPTTWGLTEAHCSRVPEKKASRVVATLTDYSPSLDADWQMLDALFSNYDEVSLWVQGHGDLKKFAQIISAFPGLRLIPPRLSHFDQYLESCECDYVGTRLHAGIRALQYGRRALIVAVDNRAVEISADIGINVCQRGDIEAIERFVKTSAPVRLSVPFGEISRWEHQFA